MYYCFLVTNDNQIKNECQAIIKQVGEIEIIHAAQIDEVDLNTRLINCLFIVIDEINDTIIKIITQVQKDIPDLAIIFYNHSLVLSNLNQIKDSSKLNLIVGENRKSILFELVKELKANYWRKIPFDKFQINVESLSPRLRKALTFIESAEISDCNINSISTELNISPGYFSQEFKRETGQSFRKFMQKLLNYYEDLILHKVNLPTKNISQLLGYSELSSFSRSFKNRKGISPTEYKKLVQI